MLYRRNGCWAQRVLSTRHVTPRFDARSEPAYINHLRTCGFYANRVALRGNFHHFRGIDEVIIIPIAALAGSETTEEASAFLNEQVDLFVEKLSAQNPMIGMFVQGPLLEQVKGMLAAQMSERFPQFIERVVERVEHRLDVSEIVRAKIEAFDLSKLEAIIYEVSARELKTIEILGGVLGFLVGLGQVAIMMLVS